MVIPKVLFQTSREPQPEYVINMIKTRAPGWEYRHFTDKEIIQYVIMNPHLEFPFILNKFHKLKFGAHKADIFRYYFLFMEGGVFIDSDAMIQTNIENIVKDYTFFSVKSYIPNTIFQGFIGCTPKHPIMYEALKDAYTINIEELTKNYHGLCANMFTILRTFDEKTYHLYVELESDKEKAATIDDSDIPNTILIHYWNSKVVPPE
jgi:mannosyltransferase OCH1-like enzyme